MSNQGGKFGRSIVPPETILIDHEDRIKILERGNISVPDIVASSGGDLLSGFGPPVNSIGAATDWYINLSTMDLYGPKETVWPSEFFELEHEYADFFVRIQRWLMTYTIDGILNNEVRAIDALGIPLPNAGQTVVRATASHPCRLRCYATPDHREADAGRPLDEAIDLQTDHGLLMELVFADELLTIHLSPTVFLYNPQYAPGEEKGAAGILPANLTNLAGTTEDITIDLLFILTKPPAGSTYDAIA